MAREKARTALDLLRGEDELLLVAFEEWEAAAADRYRHDTVAKYLLRHLAIREAARSAIVHALERSPTDERLASFIQGDRRPIRETLQRLDEMTRGITAGELNFGQDVDSEIRHAGELAIPELQDEIDNIMPLLSITGIASGLPSARTVIHHAPTHPASTPSRWEGFGPLLRLHAFYDYLRRIPTAAPDLLPDRLKETERKLEG